MFLPACMVNDCCGFAAADGSGRRGRRGEVIALGEEERGWKDSGWEGERERVSTDG
jgi:hypothetical protein